MKLAIINSLYHPYHIGGAELSVQTIAEGLAARGVDVTVFTLAADGAVQDRVLNGVRIRTFPLDNLYWPFTENRPASWKRSLWHVIDTFNPIASRRIIAGLREVKPDIVQTHNLAGFSPNIWNAPRKLGIPIVHTLHDYYMLCPKSTMFRRGRTCQSQCDMCVLARHSYKTLSHQVDRLVGVSQYVLNKHLDAGFFPNASSTVIHNAFEPSINATAAAAVTRPGGRTIVGYIGTLSEAKGVRVLLEAFTRLNPTEFELHLAGKGNDEFVSCMRAQFPQPNIHFLGKVPAEQFLPNVDVLAVPSIWAEPFGRVVIEAYSFGIPVIAASSGGLTELVEDSVSGFLVRPGDVNSLADALSRFSPDRSRYVFEPASLKQRARKFNIQKLVDSYHEVQLELFESHNLAAHA